jgi:anthranilate phosphoribosyltransferase
MDHFKPIIAKVATGSPLNRAEAENAFGVMLSGESTLAQTGAFLMALRVRGETVDEITGAATAMRQRMLKVSAPQDAIDIVGTGGDNSGSLNISTLASLISAACGVTVAKHGNRAASSKSGSADVLTALGVTVGLDVKGLERCLAKANVCFMFAPTHHASMRHVGPARIELGTRTIFNLLGPLSNPAGVKRQVVGVFSQSWVEPIAHVLKTLGSESVWVVNGSDGLDEITNTGPTHVTALENGTIKSFTVAPEDFGLKASPADAIKGNDAAYNAKALRDVVEGKRCAYRDIAVMNAAAGLIVAHKTKSLKEAAQIAEAALDDGRVRQVLDDLIKASKDQTA